MSVSLLCPLLGLSRQAYYDHFRQQTQQAYWTCNSIVENFLRQIWGANINLTMTKRRVFDEAFRQMAVELASAKGSIQEAARELGVDAGRISKWKQRYKQSDKSQPLSAPPTFTQEQQEIRRLQRELREAQVERDILKKAVSIFSRTDGKYSDL